MWFKNLQVFRLATGWAMSPGALEAALAKHPLMPCTGMSVTTRGWVEAHQGFGLVANQGLHLLIALGVEDKILPTPVIKAEVKTRAAELEKVQGYKPGKKQLRDLMERVTVELLPRAFAKQRTTRAWIDPVGGWVVVDANSPGKAEELLEHLRLTLGELPVTRTETKVSAQGAMTQWLTSGEAPGQFAIDSECELMGTGQETPTVRYLRHDLSIKEIRGHIDGGKVCTRLSLIWKERMSIQLIEPFQVRRLKSLAMDHTADPEQPSLFTPADQFAADFELMTGEFTALLAGLVNSLGGLKDSAPAPAVEKKRQVPEQAAADDAGTPKVNGARKPAPFNGDATEDPLYEQAVEVVTIEQKASVSLVQRRLGIGYNRAAGLIERMEKEQIVGSPSAGGVRPILKKAA